MSGSVECTSFPGQYEGAVVSAAAELMAKGRSQREGKWRGKHAGGGGRFGCYDSFRRKTRAGLINEKEK